MISKQSLSISKLQQRLTWLVVVMVLTLIALVITAVTVVDKNNVYVISLTYRIYMLIGFDVIFGASLGFFIVTIGKIRLLKHFEV